MQCFFFGFSVLRFCVEIYQNLNLFCKGSMVSLRACLHLEGLMPCIICYPSEVAGDAGFSALCVHPAAGCETSSQPNFSQISSASLLPERPKSVHRQFPLG